MHPLTHNSLPGSVAAGLLALTLATAPVQAEDLAQNLGPVGPNEPILTTVGSKRVIAFYVADGAQCGMNVVVWDRNDIGGNSAARLRVNLDPRQTVHIDSADNTSLDLQCGDHAKSLAIVETTKLVAAGAVH